VNEFKDSTAFLNNPLRCYVSGSITTFKSCEIVGTSTVIKLTLDTEMKVEPGNDKYFFFNFIGMLPIIVLIPNVKNFGEDLNSGVVVVRTLYDG
jgi:hypothetical protein